MYAVIEPAATPRRTKSRGRHPDNALSAAFVRSAPPARHADSTTQWLADAHEALDAAVAGAYSWPADISDDALRELLTQNGGL